MNNAVIIGHGIVGRATAKSFGIEDYYDIRESTVSLAQCANFRYIFLCLPTPNQDGFCYTQDIEKTIETVKAQGKQNIFVIRSTVIPGTCKRIAEKTGAVIVSNPEFLSEASWEQDAVQPRIAVVGSDNTEAREEIAGLYRSRFKYLSPFVTDSVTAELAKYALNLFFATKVMFANEFYEYVQEVKGNYDTVRQVLERHPWGSINHFRVFYGKDNLRGIRGRCLPKDLKAFANASGSPFFKQIDAMNRRYTHGE